MLCVYMAVLLLAIGVLIGILISRNRKKVPDGKKKMTLVTRRTFETTKKNPDDTIEKEQKIETEETRFPALYALSDLLSKLLDAIKK